ncbi:MAG: DUF349 domain-containing protein, partial [Alistipes sp.]|nr:DUF349 domain-containing protein [Alistipes sp.]
MQATPAVTEQVAQPETTASVEESVPAPVGAEEPSRPRRARIAATAEAVETESDEEPQPTAQVDFADEEAELAAQDAGLDLGEETAEEAEQLAAADAGGEERFAGKSKEELVSVFGRMIEEQPVQ